MNLSLSFGLQPPANAIRAWGARAICHGAGVELLHDRQSVAGERDDVFGTWIDSVGLPWLRAHVARVGAPIRESARVAHVDGVYAIAANTNASHGYLYIVAYEVPAGEVPDEVDTPTPAPVVKWYETPHAYVPVGNWYAKRLPCEKCSEYKSAPIHIKVKVTKTLHTSSVGR